MKRSIFSFATSIPLSLLLLYPVQAAEQDVVGFVFSTNTVDAESKEVQISIYNRRALTYGMLLQQDWETMQGLSYFQPDGFWQKFKLGFADTSIIDGRNGLVQKVLDNWFGTWTMTKTVMGVSNFDGRPNGLGSSIQNDQAFRDDFVLYTDMGCDPFSLPTVLNYVNVAAIVAGMKTGASDESGLINFYNKLATTEENKENWKMNLVIADTLLSLGELASYLLATDETQLSVNQYVGNAHALLDKLGTVIDNWPTKTKVERPQFTRAAVGNALVEVLKEESLILGTIAEVIINYRKSGLPKTETFYKAVVASLYTVLVQYDETIKTSFTQIEFEDHIVKFMVQKRTKSVKISLSREDVIFYKKFSAIVLQSPSLRKAMLDTFNKEKLVKLVSTATSQINAINNIMNSMGDGQSLTQLLYYLGTEYLVSSLKTEGLNLFKNVSTSLLKAMVPGYKLASAANDLGAVAYDAYAAPKVVPFTVNYSPENKTDANHGLTFGVPMSSMLSLHSYIQDVPDEVLGESSVGFRHKVKDILLDIDQGAMDCSTVLTCKYEVTMKPVLLMKPSPIFYQQFYLTWVNDSTQEMKKYLEDYPAIKVGIRVRNQTAGELIGPSNLPKKKLLPMEEVNPAKFVRTVKLGGQPASPSFAAIDFLNMFKASQNDLDDFFSTLWYGESKTYLKLTTPRGVYDLDAKVAFNDMPNTTQAASSQFVSSQKVYLAQDLGDARSVLQPIVRYAERGKTAVQLHVENKTASTVYYYLMDVELKLAQLIPSDGRVENTNGAVLPGASVVFDLPNPDIWWKEGAIAGKVIAVEKNVADYLASRYGNDSASLGAAISRILQEQGDVSYALEYEGYALDYRAGGVPLQETVDDTAAQYGVAEPTETSPDKYRLITADSDATAWDAEDRSANFKENESFTFCFGNPYSGGDWPLLHYLLWLQPVSAGNLLGLVPDSYDAQTGCGVFKVTQAGRYRFYKLQAKVDGGDGDIKQVGIAFLLQGYFQVSEVSTPIPSNPGIPTTSPLNDTGHTWFGNDSQNGLTTEPATHPRQDASQGRDAAAAAGTLAKKGAGRAGFDFTKIANNGSELPATAALGDGAADWACTQDNTTGLMWEVKTISGLRSQSHTYTWYNSNAATNGGNVGTASGGSCLQSGRCDTEKFVADVNAVGLCGHTDWRMPTIKELEGLVDFSIVYPGPTIDTAYFPNTPNSYFWSGSPSANRLYDAWGVHFHHGYSNGSDGRGLSHYVRLVRGGQ